MAMVGTGAACTTVEVGKEGRQWPLVWVLLRGVPFFVVWHGVRAMPATAVTVARDAVEEGELPTATVKQRLCPPCPGLFQVAALSASLRACSAG